LNISTGIYYVVVVEELSIPDNFNKAAKNLTRILEDATKSCPARRVRLSIAEGLKQFKFLCKVSLVAGLDASERRRLRRGYTVQ
jgi:hypothetical protein